MDRGDPSPWPNPSAGPRRPLPHRAGSHAAVLPPLPDPRTGHGALRVAAGLPTLAIFVFDGFTPLEGAGAVLYVLVVLIAARTGRRRDILVAGGAGLGLTPTAYLAAHGMTHVG